MLTHMETDVAVEIASSIRGNIFHFTKKNGKSDETDTDTKTVLEFKEKVLYGFEDMNFEEVKSFASTWLSKYPN